MAPHINSKLTILTGEAFKKLTGKSCFRGNYVSVSSRDLVVYDPIAGRSPRRMFTASYGLRRLQEVLSEEGKRGEQILEARANGGGKILMGNI